MKRRAFQAKTLNRLGKQLHACYLCSCGKVSVVGAFIAHYCLCDSRAVALKCFQILLLVSSKVVICFVCTSSFATTSHGQSIVAFIYSYIERYRRESVRCEHRQCLWIVSINTGASSFPCGLLHMQPCT